MALGTKRSSLGRRVAAFWDRYFSFSPDKSPKLFHALVVIFLEFFAWGLLTLPIINVLSKTFPNKTFLYNGIFMGVKGILSFLSAPMIGGMSDLWGRKPFLVITVFFTCLPIPFQTWDPVLYFVLVAASGLFSVTFSVVFAYVADVTDESNRSFAYGAVSATFALSLVVSPAAGTVLSWRYGEDFVVTVATLISLADVAYIVFAVPESLPEKLRLKSISLAQTADPFAGLRQAGNDKLILRLVFAVFLSYLPEAGQYSSFFIYLKLVIGFSPYEVALFIALVGVFSIFSQTVLLSWLIRKFGAKNAITIGLIFEMLQLICYGLGSDLWIIWGAGLVAAASSITYPAISAYISNYADDDKQGFVQGVITGVRGLCTGIGPAVFGVIFYMFGVDLNTADPSEPEARNITQIGGKILQALNSTLHHHPHDAPMSASDKLIPGPPFLFGALLVFLAILVMSLIPEVITYLPSSANYAADGHHRSGSGKLSAHSSPLGASSIAGSRHSSLSHADYYYKSVQQQNASDRATLDVAREVEIEAVQDEDSVVFMLQQPSTSCTLSDSDSLSDSDGVAQRAPHSPVFAPRDTFASPSTNRLTRSSSCKNRTLSTSSLASPRRPTGQLAHSTPSKSDANLSLVGLGSSRPVRT